MSIKYKWIIWGVVCFLPPLLFQIFFVRFDLGSIYWRKDTGLLVLDFYQGRNYIPIVYQRKDLIVEEIEIDLDQLIGDFGKQIINYELCFNRETTIRKDDIPPENEFPFKDFDEVILNVTIGEQQQKGEIFLNDGTGRDGLTVEEGDCKSLPTTLLNYQGKLTLNYVKGHLFHREFFDKLKNENNVVQYKSHPEFGERYATVLTEDFKMTIRPKYQRIWYFIICAAIMSAWIGFIQLIKSPFTKK